MARAAATALAGVATLLLGWFTVFQPFLAKPKEDILSTPGLAGLNVRQEVKVPVGSTACTSGVTVAAGTSSVRYLLAGRVDRVPKVRLRVTGPGIDAGSAQATFSEAGPDTFLTIAINPAVRTTGNAELCLKSQRKYLKLVGTDEGRSTVLPSTEVSGKPQAADISLALLGDREMTNGLAVRQAPDRIEATTGVPAALTLMIAILAVLLSTLGALAALVATVASGNRA